MNKHSLSMHCVFSKIFVYSANKVHIRVLCKGRLCLVLSDYILRTVWHVKILLFKDYYKTYLQKTNLWKLTHPQAIQDADEFVSSSEQILINSALHHSAKDHLQWMGAVRRRVQTAGKNITIIHTTTTDLKLKCLDGFIHYKHAAFHCTN